MTARQVLIEILEEEVGRDLDAEPTDTLLPDRLIRALEHRGFMIVEYRTLVHEVGHA